LLNSHPAQYSLQKNGRVSIKARLSVDTIYIHALCDSLQQLCEYYEATINRKALYREMQNGLGEAAGVKMGKI
jgi:hypothetical protein